MYVLPTTLHMGRTLNIPEYPDEEGLGSDLWISTKISVTQKKRKKKKQSGPRIKETVMLKEF